MKTTLDIPDALFRRAKARAAERGQSLKQFVTEALTRQLAQESVTSGAPPWMEGFGGLRELHEDNVRLQKLIDETFEEIEPEDPV